MADAKLNELLVM